MVPKRRAGFVDQALQVVLGRDVGGDGDRAPASSLPLIAVGRLVAGLGLARRDHHLGAVLGQPLGDRLADARTSR